MKRRITLLITLALLFLTTKTWAASGGPDAYGYTWTDSNEPNGPTYAWFPHNAPGAVQVTGLGDDNSAGMFNMNWDFHYYWGDYNTFMVGSNGWVSFQNTSNIAHCFPTIPTSGGAGDLYLAPLMSDLTFSSAFPSFPNVGQVWYWTNTKDSLFISYVNTPWWQAGTPDWYGSNTFQIFLNGLDSSITYRYQTMSNNFQNNLGCNSDIVIGIENQTGAIGLTCFTEVTPANNYAIKFKYPGTVLINVPDVSPIWNMNADNGGVFFPTGLIPSLSSNVKNVGNVALTTNTVNAGKIRNLANAIIYSSNFNIASMGVGVSNLVTFTPQATVTTAGQYYWEVVSTNTSDINSANNTRVSEISMVNMSGPTATLTYCTGGLNTGSIGWNGGALDDGVAVYQMPPVYPININSVDYYIASNAGESMIAAVYDDNGPNGTAGTLLWSDTIPANQITAGAWNTVPLPSPLTFTSGGYYVAWFMGGPNIFIATETNGPISRRSYEVLGGNWASYRDNTLQEFLIRVNVGGYPCALASGFSFANTGTNYQFSNGTTGGVSYVWDFGDGNTSTATSPTHTYANTGTYTVCLTSTNNCGTDSTCQTITVVCPAPSAGFTPTQNGLSVQLADNTTGGAISWSWSFGDGSTSTSQNPSHTYATPGNYTICLIATGQCGADTSCAVVAACTPMTVGFSNTENGLWVSFTNQSSGASSYVWDFGDGNTATTMNAVHAYPAAGFYLACLIASNACGSDTSCITVQLCAPANGTFSTSTNMLTASFSNTTVGATSFQWTFGDGNTSTLTSPSHTYATSGTYNVCLISTDACATDTTCQQVTVQSVGINDPLQGILLKAWPNPTGDVLHVATTLPSGQAGVLYVNDLTGRRLMKVDLTDGEELHVLDMQALAKGMYFLELVSEGHGRTMRVIKD